MAQRNSRFQTFVLTFSSPWNLGGVTSTEWSQTFYVSGTITHNDADATTAAIALAQPALSLATSNSHLSKIAYYPSGSNVSTTNKLFTPTDHPGTGSAYSASPTQQQQLEVAGVAHCPIGKNTRGKMIYLRKYFHDVACSSSDRNALDALTSASALLAPFNNGAGPHAVVPVSPSSGAQGGPWTMETHLYTHQLRKGKKHKQPASQSLFDSVAKTIGEAAALELLKKALTGAAAAG